VVYALPDRAIRKTLLLPAGATVREAIELSGLLAERPEIDLASNRVGVFGRLKGLDDMLRDGDRVEIYRPLKADPKEARRRRAEK
jgi:hypothetical protein